MRPMTARYFRSLKAWRSLALLLFLGSALTGCSNSEREMGTVPEASSRSANPYGSVAVHTRHAQPPALKIDYFWYQHPRPLRVWVARIDLSSAGVELLATCGADVGPEFETRCETTMQFAKRREVDLAVNASAFSPFRSESGQPMQVVGIGACDGRIYSPVHESFGALIVRQDGSVRIADPPYEMDRIDEAVSGFHMLVENGRDVVDRSARDLKPGFVGVNPRSAVGIDEAGDTLFIVVVDGRQKGVSEGTTLYEMGKFFLWLGAHHALNLDGGGSSTLVLRDVATGEYELLNRPVGRGDPDSLRLVANNLGIHLPPVGDSPAP